MMTKNLMFTTIPEIARDVERPGRYRWSVSENMRLRKKSLYSFATRREAQADADKFVSHILMAAAGRHFSRRVPIVGRRSIREE
jgi:hypothetical protein